MVRGSGAFQAARRQIEELCRAGRSPEQLAARALAAVQTAVPLDGFRVFGLDPASRLINRLLAASDSDGWARREWLRDVYLAPGQVVYTDHHLLMRLGLNAVELQQRQELSWGYPADVLGLVPAPVHERLYHELLSPAGGTVVLHLEAGGTWLAVLHLYRRDPRRPFTAEEVAFLERIVPTLSRGLAAALQRERALVTNAPTPDASGVLVLGPDRRIQLATSTAEEWLRRLRDARVDHEDGLPAAVWSVLARLRAGDGRPAAALTAPMEGGALRIEASPAGEDGSSAIVLSMERPPAAPELPSDWELTPAERRVVELLVRGQSNRQIAETLSLSENTVEYHLRHAYEKLGVRGRTQVLARFFQETFWPGLQVESSSAR